MQKPWIWTSLCCDTLAIQLNILSIKLNGRATCHLLCKGRTRSEPHISFSPLNIFEKNGRQGSDTNWTWGICEIAVTFTQKQLTFSVSDTCINLDPFPNVFCNDPSLTFSHCHLLLTSSLAGAPSVCSSSVWRWSWVLICAHLSWLISLILSPPPVQPLQRLPYWLQAATAAERCGQADLWPLQEQPQRFHWLPECEGNAVWCLYCVLWPALLRCQKDAKVSDGGCQNILIFLYFVLNYYVTDCFFRASLWHLYWNILFVVIA